MTAAVPDPAAAAVAVAVAVAAAARELAPGAGGLFPDWLAVTIRHLHIR